MIEEMKEKIQREMFSASQE